THSPASASPDHNGTNATLASVARSTGGAGQLRAIHQVIAHAITPASAITAARPLRSRVDDSITNLRFGTRRCLIASRPVAHASGPDRARARSQSVGARARR